MLKKTSPISLTGSMYAGSSLQREASAVAKSIACNCNKNCFRTSLVVQWLGIHLPMQGIQA